MPVNASNLSNPKYGYDFVISTTQASINSGLTAFLSEVDQPVNYFCFLVDRNTGNPVSQIELKELIAQTGVNPFEIPANTEYTDPQISALTQAGFCVGIKIQMGIPPGIRPKDLPPVVSLGSSASSVGFNMFCSQFTVVQNTPPSGWGNPGVWNVWSQPSGEPWYFNTKVDLTTASLDKELNTPYFNNHPDEKAALKSQLESLSATSFSLQQLMFDLANASLESMPTLQGIPSDSNAAFVLQKSFIGIYSQVANDRGLPLLSVTATVQSPDASQLELTSFERQVSQLKDNTGAVIQNPTPEQQAVSTLDHLCAANNNDLPGASSFSWNWVMPADVETESGVIAVNRHSLGSFFKAEILPTATANCVIIRPHCTAHWYQVMGDVSITATPNQNPVTEVTDDGKEVVHINYHSHQKDEDKSAASYCGAAIDSYYECFMRFSDNTVEVEQHAWVLVWICFDKTERTITPYDFTRTDVYEITVTQTGELKLEFQPSKSKTDDQKEKPDEESWGNFFTGIDAVISDIQDALRELEQSKLTSVPFDRLQSFVFPASKTFTYKTADFSDYQDLVCSITYVDPSQTKARPLRASQDGLTLSYTSEMMENYFCGQVVSPTGKFEALQAADGHALLFAIDTSDVFHVIKEQSGTGNAGWIVEDLSSALIAKEYPGAEDVKPSTFDVGQSVLDGTISLALAVKDSETDTLFFSLGNSSKNTKWTSSVAWTRYPFDAEDESLQDITIVGVMFAETMMGTQYIVVDINRLGSSNKNIARYHVDPNKETGRYWVKHDVPVDIDQGNYQSCVGQVKGAYVDGIYTSGQTGGDPQLVYTPIVNAFGEGPPMPIRLGLPGGELQSAIVAARYVEEGSEFYGLTDLYSVSGTTLYRFAADAQHDGDVGKPIVTADCLNDTTELLAMTFGGVTTLWGKNASDEVYYVSCETSQVSQPDSWSAAVPILTGIERISAYVNKEDGGNTIFASGGGKLVRVSQASKTNAKVWRSQEITLAAPPDEPSQPFNSYTTTLHVNDKNDLPAKDAELHISADSCTPFYINGLYYLVGQTPVIVSTDSSGTVTIIEAANGLNAAVLTIAISPGQANTIINPMDYSFRKISDLNSETALRDASYPTNITAGGTIGDPGSSPLVDSSTNKDDLELIGSRMADLKTAWDGVKPPPTTRQRHLRPTRPGVVPATYFRSSPRYRGIWGDIAMAAGDLFQWLKSGVKALIDIVKDGASRAWHFIAEIGGKVYRAILDTVEAITGAIEWIFDVIKTAIEQLIQFIKFLFNWDDIRRTKNVLSNVVRLYLNHQVDSLEDAKAAIDDQIEDVEETLSEWAGLDDWTPLGDVGSNPASSSTSNPGKNQTSSSMMFAHHFKSNVDQMTITSTFEDPADIIQQAIDGLLDAVSNEGDVLSGVYAQLIAVAESLDSLSVTDAIKKIAAILGEGMLSSVRVVVDALMDALAALASTAVGILETKIHIPVISDILEWIGIPEISFLDLFLWIGAVSFDIVYKIVYGDTPFPNNSNVNAIISATSWDALLTLFGGASDSTAKVEGAVGAKSKTQAISLPHEVQKIIHIAGHVSAGFSLFMGNFLVGFEAEALTAENPFAIPAAVLGAVVAVLQGGTEVLVPSCPVQNKVVSGVSMATTAAVIVSKVIFSGPVQSRLAVASSGFSGLAVGDGRATGSIVNSILVIPALFVTGWHFYELSQLPASEERSAAILGEVTNLTSYGSRICYAVATNDKDPATRQIPIIAMLACNVVSGGLQSAEGFLIE